jgi:glycosyltransferase involved in cell wall biosynthesis
MRRVVHYIPKFSPAHWGGAEEAILQSARRLGVHGFASEVWSNTIFSDVRHESINGVVVRRFPSFFLSGNETDAAGSGKAPFSVPLVRRVLSDAGIDLLHIHCHNRMASILVALARAKRIPVILSLHSRFLTLYPRWRYWFPNEFGIKYASEVVTVNRSIRDSLSAAGVSVDRIRVIPNGVDPRTFAGGDGRRFRNELGIGDEPLVITVGRICQAKNQKAVIQMTSMLRTEIPDAHWALIGFPSDSNYHRELMDGIVSGGLEGVIHVVPGLPPRSRQLVDAYAAANAVAIPSVHEAFPVVLLEAWSAGAPVVANRVGGFKDIITDGLTALLVEPQDSEGMATSLASIIRDSRLRTKLAEGGTKRVNAYTWDNVATQLASTYEQVLRSSPAARRTS